jgi:hypothetical protein
MTSINSTVADPSVRPFIFESFGVVIKIDGNTQEMIDEGERVARISLVHPLRSADGKKAGHVFELNRTKSGYNMFLNGEGMASCRGRKKFFKFFDAIVRITVGEHAVDRVFMHAGAVGWRGRAIVLPGQSFQGKSTLTAELVRQGAEYYSDDFAIFDKDGLLHPFPKKIMMRTDDGQYLPYELTIETLGGTAATEPLPVGLVLLTKYESGQKWKPVILSRGQGVLEMIPFVLPLRLAPEFSLGVLNNIASRAIIASSPRGAAKEFARVLLNFVDKNVN